jgi:hypothetical protein
MSLTKINPAFVRFVKSVADPLPPSLAKNKSRLLNLEKGLTIHGAERKGTTYRRRNRDKG